jgi:hypothetical protein
VINLPDIIYTYIFMYSYGVDLVCRCVACRKYHVCIQLPCPHLRYLDGIRSSDIFLCRAHSGDVEMGHDMPESTKRAVPLLEINKY